MKTDALLTQMADVYKSILPGGHSYFMLNIWFKLRNEDEVIPFIWLIRESQSHIYLFDQHNWGTRLAETIRLCDEINEGVLAYSYDGDELKPLFIQTALTMANDQTKSGKVYVKKLPELIYERNPDILNCNNYERKY